MKNVFDNYMRFLLRSHANGEFPAYEPRELEVIAQILMAARDYLARNYTQEESGAPKLPDFVADTYMKFVRYGLEGVPGEARKPCGRMKKEVTLTDISMPKAVQTAQFNKGDSNDRFTKIQP